MFVANFYVGLLCLCFLFTKALCKVGRKCNSSNAIDDGSCLDTEVCDDLTNSCICGLSYVELNFTCSTWADQPQTTPKYSNSVDNQGSGSLVAGILIPLFLIAFVICGVYISKRFELVKWLREKFGQRNRTYDEFMIGQDDDDDLPIAY
ncbi:uncharacterized protein LOC109536443 [Dendroctonus ponderosae]